LYHIEINEAFASQVLGCLKALNIDFDDTRVNPNGGAIAVVSLCIGIGQGLAMVIERV
jgi:acetyl-CoA acetyltransferase